MVVEMQNPFPNSIVEFGCGQGGKINYKILCKTITKLENIFFKKPQTIKM